ncbi:TMhelix containing protein [Vibrio phage 1.077.O._10N.261.45.A10]|nr:TMhelix containing protein [Vibrio phage 1.070.O._10N.261.45.B2]AUR85622.1 TMhelix containing protein [Vibrio phage 1.077.O._10N.261.45.A10]
MITAMILAALGLVAATVLLVGLGTQVVKRNTAPDKVVLAITLLLLANSLVNFSNNVGG